MTEPPPIKLRRFLQFDSNSRDEVRDVLVHRYGASDFDLRHDGDALHGIGSLLRLKSIDLGYLAFSADVQATIPSAGFFRQQFALAGFGQTIFGGSRFDVSTNESGVIPADADATYHFDRNLSQLVLRVSARALQVKLASWIGRPVGRNVEFAPSTTFQNPRQLQLRRLISFFVGEIDDENVEWSDLHRHATYDETHIICEGRYECHLGDEMLNLGPGEMMFAPRGTPHSVKSIGPETGRELMISSPGGIFDAFIDEVITSMTESGSPSQPGPAMDFRAIAAKYGIEFLS